MRTDFGRREYIPTRAEIARKCAMIRRRWSEEERYRRMLSADPDVHNPEDTEVDCTEAYRIAVMANREEVSADANESCNFSNERVTSTLACTLRAFRPVNEGIANEV